MTNSDLESSLKPTLVRSSCTLNYANEDFSLFPNMLPKVDCLFFLLDSPYGFSTAKIWIVPWSLDAASIPPNLSNASEQMTAFLIPRRTSWKGYKAPLVWFWFVKNSLKIVPISEAVTKIDPSFVKAKLSMLLSWALKLMFVFYSAYRATRTKPFWAAGVTSTEFLPSGFKAHRPLGLLIVSIASIRRKSAKL